MNNVIIYTILTISLSYLTVQAQPQATCQNFIAQLNPAGYVTVPATAIDNGSTGTGLSYQIDGQSDKTFSCTDIGSHSVILTVTDANGNQDGCIAMIIVVDQQAPIAFCNNPTAIMDATGTATVTVADVDAGCVDNCHISSITIENQQSINYTCTQSGPNPVLLRATDDYGAVGVCAAVVTVIDPIPPMAICRDSILIVLPEVESVKTLTALDLDEGSYDNCSVDIMQINGLDQKTYSTADLGMNYADLVIKDLNGNTNICTVPVEVRLKGEEEDPIISNTTDLNNNNEINLYPNPSSGLVNLNAENEMLRTVEVHNTVGQLVHRVDQIHQNQIQIDLQHLQKSNIYCFSITTSSGTYTKRIALR